MKIKDILSEDDIIAGLHTSSKPEALQELSDLIAQNYSLKADEVTLTLMEREKLGSTGIGNGVAIPHGKMNSLNRIVTCFGRSIKGIDFDSQDGRLTHLFFVLL